MSGLLFKKAGTTEVVRGAYIDFVNKLNEPNGNKPPYHDEIGGDSSRKIIRKLTKIASGNSAELKISDINGNGKTCTARNTKITVSFDDMMTVNTKLKRRVNISLPDEIPADLDYLDKFIREIITITGFDHNNANDVDEASKFLFGVMLLSRCM